MDGLDSAFSSLPLSPSLSLSRARHPTHSGLPPQIFWTIVCAQLFDQGTHACVGWVAGRAAPCSHALPPPPWGFQEERRCELHTVLYTAHNTPWHGRVHGGKYTRPLSVVLQVRIARSGLQQHSCVAHYWRIGPARADRADKGEKTARHARMARQTDRERDGGRVSSGDRPVDSACARVLRTTPRSVTSGV